MPRENDHEEKSSSHRGAMAWNVIQILMLAGALGMGGKVVNSVETQGRQISDLTWQLKLSTEKVEAMTRARWTFQHQLQYNIELSAANQTLRTPDIRKIIRDLD